MDIPDGFPPRKWIGHLQDKRPLISFQTKSERKKYVIALVEMAESLVETGKVGEAIDRMDLGFYVDKDYMLENLKKSGLLRHSAFLTKRNPVAGIAAHLLEHKSFFLWALEEENYFSSLVCFEAFYDELRKINNYINAELTKFKSPVLFTATSGKIPASRIKALLAKNDSYFLTLKQADRLCEDLNLLDFYSKEEISEAVSMLVSRYAESSGFKDYDMHFADGEYAAAPLSDELLVQTCRYKAIVELELEIEVYGFVCVKKDGAYIIDHPDDNFIRAIEISNIQYLLQGMSNAYFSHVINKDAALLTDMAKSYHEAFPHYFELKKDPFERYTLRMLPHVFIKYIKGDDGGFFREELNILYNISKELLIPYEKLQDYQLRPGFSFFDFLRLCRFFIFQYHLLAPKMEELIGKVPDQLIYRSLVGIFKKEDMILYLSMLTDKEKALIFLDMVTWKTTDAKRFLDLQYFPIIEYNNTYMVSGCIMGMSNLPRNVFLGENKLGHNIKTGQMDLHVSIADILRQAFLEQHFVTFKEIKISYKGTQQQEGDFDFVAYKEGFLFIAECKDTVHPTDLFEMRTTYNHIKKAASQLRYLLEALKDKSYITVICHQLGLRVTDIKRVATAIVLSNNKLWGYTVDGFPIRNVRELSAFVRTGMWNFSIYDDKMTRFKLWKNTIFEVDDLVHFLSDDSPHTAMYKACNERLYKYGNRLYKKIYSLMIP